MKTSWSVFSFVLLALLLLAGCATPVDPEMQAALK
jgi:predicted small secreted protein